MQSKGVEILLVEDNANDADLTLRALKQRNLANQVHVCRDGAEAMDFFSAGPSPVPGLYWLLLNHHPQ
jgi:two-component system response regulator